jgi:hypothetical protein
MNNYDLVLFIYEKILSVDLQIGKYDVLIFQYIILE